MSGAVDDRGPEPGREGRRDYTGRLLGGRGALPWPWRIAQASLTLAAAVVLALVIAHWGWRWFGPAATPLPPPPEATGNLAAAITAVPWFGTEAAEAPSTPGAAPPASSLAGVHLLGIVSGPHGDGYALFHVPDRGSVLVHSGDELAPGITLEDLGPDGVRLRDHGELRELALRPPAGSAPSSAGVATPTLPPLPNRRASVACTPPGGGTTSASVFRLNAELLTGVAGRPESFAAAFTPDASGLVVREGNAFAAMLGMKAGDRVAAANGVPLHGPEDVLVAVVRPLLASQAVRVTGQRDGNALEWVLVNAGACPA